MKRGVVPVTGVGCCRNRGGRSVDTHRLDRRPPRRTRHRSVGCLSSGRSLELIAVCPVGWSRAVGGWRSLSPQGNVSPWGGQDSNLRPRDYESPRAGSLTCRYCPIWPLNWANRFSTRPVDSRRFPPSRGFSADCSTPPSRRERLGENGEFSVEFSGRPAATRRRSTGSRCTRPGGANRCGSYSSPPNGRTCGRTCASFSRTVEIPIAPAETAGRLGHLVAGRHLSHDRLGGDRLASSTTAPLGQQTRRVIAAADYDQLRSPPALVAAARADGQPVPSR